MKAKTIKKQRIHIVMCMMNEWDISKFVKHKHIILPIIMDIGITEVLGELIRDLRKSQNLSQAELAVRSGIHINTIHLLESGVNEPKLSTLFFIAKGIGLDELKLMQLLCEKYYGMNQSEKIKK